MAFEWKKIVQSVAPALGTALLGPMGGVATKFIADKLLGNPNASEVDIANAINTATPEQLIKLKEINNQFEVEMAKLGVDIYKIDAEDRNSARVRQTNMRDWSPNIIAFTFVMGYFGIIFYVLNNGLSQNEEILVARIQDAVMLILAYFFGSSAGSRIKDHLLGIDIDKPGKNK